jgi:hypothetical protein
MRVKKYNNGGKTKKGTAQSDTLEVSKEQVVDNYNAEIEYKKIPKKTYEEELEEAAARRKRNENINAINRKIGKPEVLDDQNLKNEDGSPLRGGPKITPIAPKEVPTKTPKKDLERPKAVIPVPTRKELRQRKKRK